MLSINEHQVKLIDIIYCCPQYEFMDDGWVSFMIHELILRTAIDNVNEFMDDGWVSFMIFVGRRLYFLLSKTSIYDAIASFKINLFWVNISFARAIPLFAHRVLVN